MTTDAGPEPVTNRTVVPGTLPGPVTHPYLFFNDIRETPGYQNRNLTPWSGYEYEIIRGANIVYDRDFSVPWPGDPREDIMSRAGYAKTFAMAWHITGDEKYAKKAVEALTNIGVGDPYSPHRRSVAVRDYSIAYDLVQPYMSEQTDAKVRDKLAKLADQVYRELNSDGTDTDYVTFWDYHGQAYINVAFAGLALADYDNPGRLSLKSGPSDWLKCGTDYFFVSDPLHDRHKPIVYYGFDAATGKDLIGYNTYTLENMVLFAQAYTHVTGENYVEKYPIMKGHFTAEVWDSYPNGVEATYETLLNLRFNYHACIANLLDEVNRSAVLRHYDNVNANIRYMPDPSTEWNGGYTTAYLCEHNYNDLPRNPPPYTSHLNPDAMFQTMRNGWSVDSDFLSMVTTQPVSTGTTRLEIRADQLGIQYYGKGNILLADGGENKWVRNPDYGMAPVYHNVVVFENPRQPFPVDAASGGRFVGGSKGDASGVTTPARVSRTVTTPWMDILTAEEHITGSPNWTGEKEIPLSSPIDLERTVLLPEDGYFLVIDRAEGSEPWIYRNIWRPASFEIVKTLSPGNIGRVIGDLSLGGYRYDWQAADYAVDVDTGIVTEHFEWSTTNPYGNPVELKVYSVPASKVYLTKSLSVIGGNDMASDVYSPIVYFRSQEPEKNMYRVTALMSRYQSDPEASAAQVKVTGTGNALSISAPGYVDTVYTGAGDSRFGKFATNADTAYIRASGDGYTRYTILNGTYLDAGERPLVKATGPMDYLTVDSSAEDVSLRVKSDTYVTITLSQLTLPAKYRVLTDGVQRDNWEAVNSDTIRIKASHGEHTYQILPA
ncbi:hypothetical protein [Methanocella arvoryzae]|uniref:hypothetical protein n=1 Tax=Methanocella arvoryzae TaxID=1175445 RepID=UPI0011D2ADB7|nr:hypothetical protein [Methanocella arvoryzae]